MVSKIFATEGHPYNEMGENLARISITMGTGTDEMLRIWKESPTHNALMLKPEYKDSCLVCDRINYIDSCVQWFAD